MRAMRLGSPTLLPATVEEVEKPVPAPGEVLVRVHAVGVTPSELQWYPTTHAKSGESRIRTIPGHEFSGVVAAVGRDVLDMTVGQAVFGMNDWFAAGATAEYCVTEPRWIAPKPAKLTHAEAASVPIGALTAWQGLDRVRPRRGERVLIQGASGAVGVFVVQLVHGLGAHAIAVASAKNLELLNQLGADEALDYRAGPFESQVGKVDVVFDAVGGETLQRSWDALSPGGRLVTIAADSEGRSDERSKQAFFIVEANRDQLMEIAGMLDAGKLKTVVDCTVPLEQAPNAYAGKVGDSRGRGKVIVQIIPDAQS